MSTLNEDMPDDEAIGGSERSGLMSKNHYSENSSLLIQTDDLSAGAGGLAPRIVSPDASLLGDDNLRRPSPPPEAFQHSRSSGELDGDTNNAAVDMSASTPGMILDRIRRATGTTTTAADEEEEEEEEHLGLLHQSRDEEDDEDVHGSSASLYASSTPAPIADNTNRWGQFDTPDLPSEAAAASAAAVASAAERAAFRDVLSSPNPEQTGESVMVLPIESENAQMRPLDITQRLDEAGSSLPPPPPSTKLASDSNSPGIFNRVANIMGRSAPSEPLVNESSSDALSPQDHRVRMDALQMLHLSNGNGGDGGGEETVSANGYSSPNHRNRETSSLAGLGLTSSPQKRHHRPPTIPDETNPFADDEDDEDENTSSLVDVEARRSGPFIETRGADPPDDTFQEEVLIQDDNSPKKTAPSSNSWSSRYSVDRHLLALNAGTTTNGNDRILDAMDRQHSSSNKRGPLLVPSSIFRSSPSLQTPDRQSNDESKSSPYTRGSFFFSKRAEGDDGSFNFRKSASEKKNKNIFSPGRQFISRLSSKNKKRADDAANTAWTDINLADRSSLPPPPPPSTKTSSSSSQNTAGYAIKSGVMSTLYLCSAFIVRYHIILIASFIIFVLLTLVILAVAFATNSKSDVVALNVGQSVSFYALSNIPQNPTDEANLARDLANVNATEADFLIHLGDVSRASTSRCVSSVYESAASILRSNSPVPVLVLPGNYDWNDCPNPEVAWSYWQTYLSRLDESMSLPLPRSLPVQRQLGQEENFATLHKGVLFLGVHVVDGAIQPNLKTWNARHARNVRWIEETLSLHDSSAYRALVIMGHAPPLTDLGDFFWIMAQDLEVYAPNKPTLYLHAATDGGWKRHNPFDDAPNIMAVGLDEGSVAPPVQITVGFGSDPFRFQRGNGKEP